MKLNRWPYQLALVTGASSGLGRALAVEIAAKGTSLLLTGRNTAELQQTAALLSVPTELVSIDLSIPSERKELIELIRDKAPDLIINNAGFGIYGDAAETSISEQLKLIEVNITALVDIALESTQTLLKLGKTGTLLNVSSAAAFFPFPSFATYAASKAFVLRFSEALDQELRPHGIRSLTTCPGQIETHFRSRASGDFPQKNEMWTMKTQRAAELIIDQIEHLDPKRIIDWKYRFARILIRLIPQPVLMKVLRKSIQKRYSLRS